MKSVAFVALIAAASAQTLDMNNLLSLGMLSQFGGHSALPLLATGALGQEQLAPFMLSQQFGNAHTLLPLMATGAFADPTAMTNFMVADRFAYMNGMGHGSMLPLIAGGVLPQEQVLPFMMADRFAKDHGMHTNFLPLAAAGVMGQEQLLPFMMADEFAYRGGQQMLPMLTSGIVAPEMIPQFMVADRFAHQAGFGTDFLPLAAAGVMTEEQLLPFMAGDFLSHELPRHVAPRHHGYAPRSYYGARRAPMMRTGAPMYRAPVVAAEASAEGN